MPETLYERVVEVNERVVIHENVKLVKHPDTSPRVETAITGEKVR